MANATINILECNNTRIRLVVTQGDNPLSRVTIFTNGVERGFWIAPPLNNEKSYNWQPNHFNDGLNEIRVNARDNQGNVVSEFRYIIKGLDEDSTLSEIITENENIKNDISGLITRFKSNLINKGVEVTNNDKMSNLIDKINDISGVFEEPAVKLRLFHADSNADKLYELDVNTLQVIKTVNSPNVSPRDIGGGFDGNKLRLFHANSNTRKLYELNIDTLQPIKTVNSPGTEPSGIGGGFDGNKLRLFHADSNTDKLHELNIDTLQPIKTVNSPGTEPRGIGGGHYTINKKYVIHNGIKYELKEV